jgi:hypothetical protein
MAELARVAVLSVDCGASSIQMVWLSEWRCMVAGPIAVSRATNCWWVVRRVAVRPGRARAWALWLMALTRALPMPDRCQRSSTKTPIPVAVRADYQVGQADAGVGGPGAEDMLWCFSGEELFDVAGSVDEAVESLVSGVSGASP